MPWKAGTRLPSQSLIVSASFRTLAAGEGLGIFRSPIASRPLRAGMLRSYAPARRERAYPVGKDRARRAHANPYRAHRAEKALLGEDADNDSLVRDAAQIASEERPWPARTDLHATGAFRSKAAVAAVVRALRDAREPLLEANRSNHDGPDSTPQKTTWGDSNESQTALSVIVNGKQVRTLVPTVFC
jgi:hypothetical protein